MSTFIGLLRGVNVGGHKKLRMSDLKSACESLGMNDVRTYLQSGNVVFRGKKSGLAEAIRERTGVETKVILRTPEELREVIAANPFEDEARRDPGRLLVFFLEKPLAREAEEALRKASGPERIHLAERELYIYFPNGAGASKLMTALTEKKLGVVATARNWNTVTALLRMAEETGSSS